MGLLTVAGDALAVGIERRKGVEWLECRPCTWSGHLPELADVLLARRELRSVRGVRVLLHPSLVQLRTLHSIPPVAQRQLPSLVRAQAKRFFRTNGSDLVVDALWTDDVREVGSARAVAVDLPLVEALETAVERTGARLLGISPGGSGVERRLTLETPGGRARRTRRAMMGLLRYVVAAAFMWAVAAGLYVGDLLLDRTALRAEAELLQGPLTQVASVRRDIERFAPIASTVTGQGPRGAWVTRRLATITEALPDSAHILHFTATKHGVVRMDIRTSDPVAVIDALSTALAEAVSLDAPPREEMTGDRLWYRIPVTVEGRHERP